jgi:hypothetical protein
VGLVILAVFLILVIIASITPFRAWNNGQAQIGQREPLPSLRYCSLDQLRPCVLSFSLNPQGNMVVNILANSPDFYLKIKQAERETIYKCQNVEGFSTNLACTGEKMPVGEPLSFVIVSTTKNILLAEGTFPIIGLAIATPEIFVTPTFVPAFDRPPN